MIFKNTTALAVDFIISPLSSTVKSCSKPFGSWFASFTIFKTKLKTCKSLIRFSSVVTRPIKYWNTFRRCPWSDLCYIWNLSFKFGNSSFSDSAQWICWKHPTTLATFKKISRYSERHVLTLATNLAINSPFRKRESTLDYKLSSSKIKVELPPLIYESFLFNNDSIYSYVKGFCESASSAILNGQSNSNCACLSVISWLIYVSSKSENLSAWSSCRYSFEISFTLLLTWEIRLPIVLFLRLLLESLNRESRSL